jgi:hypothetical protein
VGILGISLPILWTHMAESANHSAKCIQMISLKNVEKNMQNILNAIRAALPLDGENCTYCGYEKDRFTVTTLSDTLDGNVFMIKEKSQKLMVNGSVKRITYAIYPWNRIKQRPQLENSCGVVGQFVVISALNFET